MKRSCELASSGLRPYSVGADGSRAWANQWAHLIRGRSLSLYVQVPLFTTHIRNNSAFEGTGCCGLGAKMSRGKTYCIIEAPGHAHSQ